MSADDGTVNEQVFKIRVLSAKLMQLLEDAGIRLTGKALIGGIPVAILCGE
jgi:hypothetical protein